MTKNDVERWRVMKSEYDQQPIVWQSNAGPNANGVLSYRADTDFVLAFEYDRVRAALEGMLKHYVDLAGSGDCGHWDPETESIVIEARAALRPYEPSSELATDDPPILTAEDLKRSDAVWKVGGKVVSKEEGMEAFRRALSRT